MKAAVVVALAVFALTTGAAAAETSNFDECIQTELDLKAYLRVMQSCSDAVWERGDVGEADALCAAARALQKQHAPALQRQVAFAKDPASADRSCPRQNVLPLMALYLKALDWDLAYLEVRQDHRTHNAPAPLDIIRFEDPK